MSLTWVAAANSLHCEIALWYDSRTIHRVKTLGEEAGIPLRFQMINKLNLIGKLVVANSIIIIVVIVAGVWIARYLRQIPDIALAVVLAVAGSLITALASFLILRSYFQPLVEFRKAVELIHRGTPPSIVADRASDPAIGGVIRSVRDALDRLEDESLQHTTLILNSIEAERQRIGRELHDQTSQTLATALINLKLADSALGHNTKDVRKKLTMAKHLIEHSLEQIKICVYDLRPVMLDDLGLVPTLRWHIKTHLAGTGLAITTDFEDADKRMPRNIETTLYRVAQEALANVIKHAHATRVSIRLETRAEYTALAISDNGNGFDLNSTLRRDKNNCSGLGLDTIRERIKLVKGTLNIETGKGVGTQINIVVPLPPLNSLNDQG
jgi:two-component system, NarL family, sensor histidine kinase UhpB